MRVALIVSPRKACQLHHVAAPETAEAVKRVCLGIDHERGHAVLVAFQHTIGAPRVPDFTKLARPREPVCQVYYWHGLFGGVYRLCVGNSPISRRIGGVSWVRVVILFHCGPVPFRVMARLLSGGVVAPKRLARFSYERLKT